MVTRATWGAWAWLAIRMTRRGAPLQAVQTHGRWKSLQMPAKYTKERRRLRHWSGSDPFWLRTDKITKESISLLVKLDFRFGEINVIIYVEG